VQPPVYPPFFSAIRDTGRRIVENPLIERDGRWTMDFDQLEQLRRACRFETAAAVLAAQPGRARVVA
jgi:bifunctional pyridoxal-dependent enzyme with beta-cystathionase and maltose regulon repressor activities